MTPTQVVILGMMLCAESILSKIYERHVLNKMADGLYSVSRKQSMNNAEGLFKLGISFRTT